jgi:hypothetical protein
VTNVDGSQILGWANVICGTSGFVGATPCYARRLARAGPAWRLPLPSPPPEMRIFDA